MRSSAALTCAAATRFTGLQHVAQLTQISSLELAHCKNVRDRGMEQVA